MPKAKANSSRKEGGRDKQSQIEVQDSNGAMPLLASKGAVDSRLAALFAGSTGPITASRKVRSNGTPQSPRKSKANRRSHNTIDEGSMELLTGEESLSSGSEGENDETDARSSPSRASTDSSVRKRKRKEENEELEDTYMRRVVELENKEVEKRRPSKKSKSLERYDVTHDVADHEDSDSDSSQNGSGTDEPESHETGDSSDEPEDSVPQHESLNASTRDVEIEKSSRTVFLANVSISAISSKSAKKTLLNHLTSVLLSSSVNNSDNHGPKVESIRFRSTAFSSTSIPKRAAYARKELMDATTKSTNAYVVYSTADAAREAVKRLNGTVVLDRHLRVDSVAHPAKIDHRRCVFVGNLGFVNDESRLQAAAEEEGKQKKTKKQPADVEEGLWRHFGEVGTVESVRVVRDPKTRVGKGFAYVQFVDPNSVEAALLYHDKKFPPLLPRKLRVTRAKRVQKSTPGSELIRTGKSNHRGVEKQVYNPKVSSNTQSLRGRASKLFGRAGAAILRRGAISKPSGKNLTNEESDMVLEGHQATSQSRPHGLKPGKSGPRKGKPQTRSSRRATAWKATKGKTTK